MNNVIPILKKQIYIQRDDTFNKIYMYREREGC